MNENQPLHWQPHDAIITFLVHTAVEPGATASQSGAGSSSSPSTAASQAQDPASPLSSLLNKTTIVVASCPVHKNLQKDRCKEYESWQSLTLGSSFISITSFAFLPSVVSIVFLTYQTAHLQCFHNPLQQVPFPEVWMWLPLQWLNGLLLLSYLSWSLADHWGTTVDFTTSFLHSSWSHTQKSHQYSYFQSSCMATEKKKIKKKKKTIFFSAMTAGQMQVATST